MVGSIGGSSFWYINLGLVPCSPPFPFFLLNSKPNCLHLYNQKLFPLPHPPLPLLQMCALSQPCTPTEMQLADEHSVRSLLFRSIPYTTMLTLSQKVYTPQRCTRAIRTVRCTKPTI